MGCGAEPREEIFGDFRCFSCKFHAIFHSFLAPANPPSARMPLVREEVIHGWPCKFYDNGNVNVGTRADDRFSVKVPADVELSWFTTRLHRTGAGASRGAANG